MTLERGRQYTSPFFPEGVEPGLLKSMLDSVKRQYRLEKGLDFGGSSSINAIQEDSEGTVVNYNLNSLTAIIGARQLANMLYLYRFLDRDNLTVIDVGGGTGGFLKALARMTRNVSRIKPTLTSLIDFFPGQDMKVSTGVNFQRICIEMPPKKFYRAFDVVVSVNGPLVWSEQPEVVLNNLVSMVNPRGCLFIATSSNLHHRDFAPLNSLESNDRVKASVPIVVHDVKMDSFLHYSFSLIR